MQYIWLKYYTYPDHAVTGICLSWFTYALFCLHCTCMRDIKLPVYVIVIIDMIYLRM